MEPVDQREKTQNPEKITPRRIEGLSRMVRQESVSGSAGENHTAVNAFYNGGEENEFTFVTGSSGAGQMEDVTFRLILPYKQWMEASRKGGVGAPLLISDVFVRDKEKGEIFMRRALEHNAFEIREFLRKGGKIGDLPATKIMPDVASLQ